MSQLKKLASQTAIYGLSSILGRLINFVLVPLYTDKFSTATYGVISDLYSWVGFFVVILSFGMETTFFKMIRDHDQNINEKKHLFNSIFSFLMLLNGLFIFTFIVLSSPIADILSYGDHVAYIVMLTLVLGIDGMVTLPMADLRNQGKARDFVKINLLSIFLNVGLNILFIYFLGPENYAWIGIWVIFAANLAASFLKMVLLKSYFIQFKWHWDTLYIKPVLKYAYPLVIAGLGGIINELLDRQLLKFMIAKREGIKAAMHNVGVYSAVYKFAIFNTLANQAFRYAAEPFFFDQNKKNDKKVYLKVMNFYTLVIMAMFIFVSTGDEWLKHLFLRQDSYWEGMPIVPILLLANVFLGIYYNHSVWYKFAAKTNMGARITWIGVGVTLLVNIAFIPSYGYYASAWATLLCYLSMVIASHFLSKKYSEIKYNWRKVGVYITFGIVFYTISLISSSLYWSLICSFTLPLIYLIIGAKIERVSINPLPVIKKYIKK